MVSIGPEAENQQTDQNQVNAEDTQAQAIPNQNSTEVQESSVKPLEKQAHAEKPQESKSNRNKKTNQQEAHRQAINAWVAQLETVNPQTAKSESEEEWWDVDEKEIENLLQQTQGLSRMALMSKLGVLPKPRVASAIKCK